MKTKIILCWLIVFSLLPFIGTTQVYLKADQRLSDTLSYRQNFDHFINNLDKTKFSTGVLYDRVYPFARLHNFSPENPKDTSSYEHFIQAYYELYLASYNNSGMKTFQEVKKQVSEVTSKGYIPLGIISYQFN